MGLDMYLEARRYLWREEREDLKIEGIDIPQDCEVKTIMVEVGYWRKANHIHSWFVDNVQDGNDDCRDAYVSRDDLKRLLAVCREVLSNSQLVEGTIKDGERLTEEGWQQLYADGQVIIDPSVAEELLPTREGFFFGGTDYDEWYYQDVVNTIKIIERALDMPKGWDFYYSSSW